MRLRTDKLWTVPIACGALAVALTVVSLVPLLRPVGWNLSALPRVAGPNTPMGERALAIDPGFRTVSGGYDGQFNWGIAIDPLARGYIHQRFDNAPYRYGHPLYGWLGWLASGDTARAVPTALIAIGLAAMFAAGALAAGLGRVLGGSGWEGLFVALNPGLIFSATHDLTEPLSTALMLAGLLSYLAGKRWIAAAWFVLLILSKEQFALVPAALALWDLVRSSRRLANAAVLASSILPPLAWWVYVEAQLHQSFLSHSGVFGFPLAGWRRTLVDSGVWSYATDYYQFLLGESTLIVVIPMLALLVLAGIRALRFRTPIDLVYLLLGVLLVFLGLDSTYILRDSLRIVSVTLVLVPFVLVSGRRPPAPRTALVGPADERERGAGEDLKVEQG
ncbi:MAG TPA: hypothetical protein VIG35_07285 [Gaiellaceae bacterium]